MANNINLDLEQLKGLGIENAEDALKAIKNAAEVAKNGNASADVAKQLADTVVTELKSIREDIVALQNRTAEEDGATELKALEESGLKKAFDAGTPEQKAAILAEAEEKHGTGIARLGLLSGNFEKALTAPLSSLDSNTETVKHLRDTHNMVVAVAAITGAIEKGRNGTPKVHADEMEGVYKLLERDGNFDMETYRKAAADVWDTATAGDGAEWLPTNMTPEYIDAIFMPLEVASLFRRVTMTSKTFKMPRVIGRSRAGLMGETTTADDIYTNKAPVSQQESTDITFAARKLGVLQGFSDEVEQDAIVPTAQMVLRSIGDGIGASIEDTVLNGSRDTFNDLDNASGGNELWTTTAAAQGRELWDGIRKAMGSTVKIDSGGTLTVAQLRSARKKMGRYAKNPRELVWIISVNSLMEVLGLPEVITVDKYGAGATILQGEIGRIDNIRIVVSEFVYTNLAATGVYTGAGNTKTAMYLVWVPAWAFGDRRQVRIEQDRMITSQLNYAVGSWRGDFRKLYGSETTEAQIYNLSA
jgi:N4-gp56 family major capsid protein